jgi:hyaluronoglucosaminidase
MYAIRPYHPKDTPLQLPLLPPLGLIEGFYGRPWSWADRLAVIARLAPVGYGFYLYAPKADVYLRKRWQALHPPEMASQLQRLATACRAQGVRFGVGLSPYEIYRAFDAEAQSALAYKLEALEALGIDDLALLFDDMRGDVPDLAARQIEIVQWVQARTRATRLLVCPSYYSDDPVLDRVFGARPEGYLETLGAELAPDIEIFWTGEEVCSRAFSVGHLQRVATQLQRKPFLWDNYPVNDGQRMSQYLYLRGFTGRPATIGDAIAAHGINPALQPTLACIPALTLIDSYQQGDAYEYRAAGHRAARQVLGSALGDLLHEDLLTLQDIGLDRLGDKAAFLQARYQGWDHPGAQEIIAWLAGAYRITDELVQTQ